MRVSTCAMLAVALFAGMAHAAQWQEVPCDQLYSSLENSQGPDRNLQVVYPPVRKELEALYPGSRWDYILSCKKAEIQTPDLAYPLNLNVRVQYTAECDWEAEGADFSKYVCRDANDVQVGDVGVAVTFDILCDRGWAARKDCEPNNVAMKVTKGPVASTPTPIGKWVNTGYSSIPPAVLTAALSKIRELSPLKQAGPLYPGSYGAAIPNYKLLRKEDGQGNVVYRLPAVTLGRSLAGKSCSYPFLYQYVTVEVALDKTGAISFSNNPIKFKKVGITDGNDPDNEEKENCTRGAGPKGAAWKKAMAKAKAFVKGLPKSKGGMGPGK